MRSWVDVIILEWVYIFPRCFCASSSWRCTIYICKKLSQGQHRFLKRHTHKCYIEHQEIQSVFVVHLGKKLFGTLTITLQKYSIITTSVLIFVSENFDLQIDLLHIVVIWAKLHCVNYSYFRSATNHYSCNWAHHGRTTMRNTWKSTETWLIFKTTEKSFKTGWQKLCYVLSTEQR